MDNLGTYLKSQREERGIELEEVSSITKIHVRSLEMMEHSQWKALPPEPFIRGFLSAYCRYVGLDPKDVLEKYRLETNPVQITVPVVEDIEHQATTTEILNTEPESEVEEKTLAYELPKKNNQWKIGAGAVAAALVFVVLPLLLKNRNTATTIVVDHSVSQEAKTNTAPATEVDKRESVQSQISKAIPVKAEKPEAPAVTTATAQSANTEKRSVATVPVPDSEPGTTAQTSETKTESTLPSIDAETNTVSPTVETKTAILEPSAETPPSVPTAVHTLIVKVKNKSWSKIVVDGTAPVQKTLSPDETYTYTANEKIKLVLGNSAGSEILYNGEKADGLKIDGTIRQFVFPRNSRFPQDPPKRKVASPDVNSPDYSPVNTDSGLPKEEN